MKVTVVMSAPADEVRLTAWDPQDPSNTEDIDIYEPQDDGLTWVYDDTFTNAVGHLAIQHYEIDYYEGSGKCCEGTSHTREEVPGPVVDFSVSAATRISVIAPRAIAKGKAGVLRANIGAFSNTAYAGQNKLRVTLQRHAPTGWLDVASTRSSTAFGLSDEVYDGWASVAVKPTATTSYRWRFAGTSKYTASTSRAFRLAVRR